MALIPSLLTIREACELLGVSRRTVSRWITRGLIRRAGQLTVPDETRGGSLALIEIADPSLASRLTDAARARLNAGQPLRFLCDRLALAALGERLEARATGEEAATPATELARLMTGFDDLIDHLGTVREMPADRVGELQRAADRLRTDATFAARTHELEEILHAVQEVRRREDALLIGGRRAPPRVAPDGSAGQDGIVELEEETSTPFEYSERDDALDAEYLAATSAQLASEEATVSEILRWMPLDPTFDVPPSSARSPTGRSTLSDLAARLEQLRRLQEQLATALADIARELAGWTAEAADLSGTRASPGA